MGLREFAERVQADHSVLIDDFNRADEWEDRRTVINALESLQRDFTVKALPLVGVMYPAQLLTTDPDHAVIIAVRSDINDTISRGRAAHSSEKLQKRLKEMPSTRFGGLGSVNFNLGSPTIWVIIGLGLAIFLGGRK